MDDNNALLLRPEAQPYNIDSLSQSQRKALLAILKKIKQTSDAVSGSSRKEEQNGSLPKRAIPVQPKKPNRNVLLSGGRGSGKTSVLLTLVKALSGTLKEEDGFWGTSNEGKEIKQYIGKHNLCKRIVWLRILEMENLPNPTNLLASILVRIGNAVDRFMSDCPAPPCGNSNFCRHPDTHHTMLKLSRLQQDVAQVWNGNLEQRAAELDSDVYAVDVLRSEQNRLKLNERLEDILDELSDRFLNDDGENRSIFILPVDDFDMNPERCVELMRLIRLITAPRLFTLVLGDRRVVSDFYNLNVVSRVARHGGDSDAGVVPMNIPYDECRLGHEISANAIRKLFPPSHIIRLVYMECQEVLEFKPNGQKETIRSFLSKIPVRFNTGCQLNDRGTACLIAGTGIENMMDLFSIRVGDLVGTAGDLLNADERTYITTIFLKKHPRHVQDFWRLLKGQGKPEAINNTGILIAAILFGEMAREGLNLTMVISHAFRQALVRDCTGELFFNTSHMEFTYKYGSSILIPQRTTTLGIRHPRNWEVKLNSSMWNQTSYNAAEAVTLYGFTSASVMFLHDLMAFSDPRKLIGRSLMSSAVAPEWAYALWPEGDDFGIRVPWPSPPWLTLFECDLMQRCWVQVWRWIDHVRKHHPSSDRHNLNNYIAEYLSYSWMRIATNIIAGTKIYEKRCDEFFATRADAQKAIINFKLELRELKINVEACEEKIKGAVNGAADYKYHESLIDEVNHSMKSLVSEVGNVFNILEDFGSIVMDSQSIPLMKKLSLKERLANVSKWKKILKNKSRPFFENDSQLDFLKDEASSSIERFLDIFWLIKLPDCKDVPDPPPLIVLPQVYFEPKFLQGFLAVWDRPGEFLAACQPEENSKNEHVGKIDTLIASIGNYDSLVSYLDQKLDGEDKLGTKIEDLIRCLEFVKSQVSELVQPESLKGKLGEIEVKVNEIGDQYRELLKKNRLSLEMIQLVDDMTVLTDPEDYRQCERRERLIRGWLAGIACILAPESGIPDSVRTLFFQYDIYKGNKLGKMWIEPDIAQDIRRLRTRAAVKFFDEGAIGLLCRLFEPRGKNMFQSSLLNDLYKEFATLIDKLNPVLVIFPILKTILTRPELCMDEQINRVKELLGAAIRQMKVTGKYLDYLNDEIQNAVGLLDGLKSLIEDDVSVITVEKIDESEFQVNKLLSMVTGEMSINLIDGGTLCPCMEDIIHQSKLRNGLRNKYAGILENLITGR